MKHTLATFAALTAAPLVCVSTVQANTYCRLYTKTSDDERKENYHWSYVTSLKKQPPNPKDHEYDTWAGADYVNNQIIYFEGSIHKSSVPNQGGHTFVYMKNRLNNTRTPEEQKPAHFRVQWLLKSIFEKSAPNPNYYLDSGDNCSGFDETVPFQAEEVVGVWVFQREDGVQPQV